MEQAWLYASLMFSSSQVRTGHLMVGVVKTKDLHRILDAISEQFQKINADTLVNEFKDIVSGTYVLVVTGGVAAAMIAWQKRDEIRANREKKKATAENVSVYGRPLQKADQ